jgi:phosphoenolpyruvate carboxylase
MRARVMQLWQTRLLRFTKLTVADEIENALSYYEATFLREIPKIYADLERELGQHPVHSFLRMGQWIGGDRDGNPNVSAADAGIRAAPPGRSGAAPLPDRGALAGQRAVAVGHAGRLSPEMQALAERSPDTNEHRQDEPYRRALTGMYARLAATLKDLTGGEAARHAVAPQNPYATGRRFSGRPAHHRSSLLAHHGAALVAQRLHPLIRAVEVFGFHLATVDLRQSSDKHEEVVAELLAVARIEPNYSAWTKTHARACCCRLLNDARPLRVLGAAYSAHAHQGAGHL